MTDKDNLNLDDYMQDMDLEDMGRMDMPMMQCPIMQCPMMQCPMMNYMGGPMYMNPKKHKGGHHQWNLEDLYEKDEDMDCSSDDKEGYYYKKSMEKDGHDWCPHPYYKKK
ncbi:hypothetical protein SAMN02745176_02342 [Lutispora thermophila DSM 19022]|uniref:Uncharacterized protein n=2 Tax=Lutispora TaxID=667112 RepID=A0A1M6GEB5_9FIRM|nr:hypothetical protein SAMN02745176_02342 [Lutispora thermophila DSM 19022]